MVWGHSTDSDGTVSENRGSRGKLVAVHDVSFTREAARFIAWLETRPPTLPDPADQIIALAQREMAIDEARLAEAAG